MDPIRGTWLRAACWRVAKLHASRWRPVRRLLGGLMGPRDRGVYDHRQWLHSIRATGDVGFAARRLGLGPSRHA